MKHSFNSLQVSSNHFHNHRWFPLGLQFQFLIGIIKSSGTSCPVHPSVCFNSLQVSSNPSCSSRLKFSSTVSIPYRYHQIELRFTFPGATYLFQFLIGIIKSGCIARVRDVVCVSIPYRYHQIGRSGYSSCRIRKCFNSLQVSSNLGRARELYADKKFQFLIGIIKS